VGKATIPRAIIDISRDIHGKTAELPTNRVLDFDQALQSTPMPNARKAPLVEDRDEPKGMKKADDLETQPGKASSRPNSSQVG
jgi:hypothetical protein